MLTVVGLMLAGVLNRIFAEKPKYEMDKPRGDGTHLGTAFPAWNRCGCLSICYPTPN